MSTWYLSFGSLRVGEKFRFTNPFKDGDDAGDETLLEKVSPRKYRVLIGEGNPSVTFSTSVKSAVVVVKV